MKFQALISESLLSFQHEITLFSFILSYSFSRDGYSRSRLLYSHLHSVYSRSPNDYSRSPSFFREKTTFCLIKDCEIHNVNRDNGTQLFITYLWLHRCSVYTSPIVNGAFYYYFHHSIKEAAKKYQPL